MKCIRRKYTSPDGVDWRDPNMPVYRLVRYEHTDWFMKAVEPKDVQAWHQHKMQAAVTQLPSYKEDKSYWWSKRNKNNLK